MRQHRPESVYLTRLVGGVAVIDDHAVAHEDAEGTYWTLASGRVVLNTQGAPVVRATLADIEQQSVSASQSWRREDFASSSPGNAELVEAPYEQVAFQIRDGIVSDYSVWVEDLDLPTVRILADRNGHCAANDNIAIRREVA